MFAVTRFRVPAEDVLTFTAEATELLAALGVRHGFRDGALGRAADDPELFALHTSWNGVGTYRRALSAAEVKLAGAPVGSARSTSRASSSPTTRAPACSC